MEPKDTQKLPKVTIGTDPELAVIDTVSGKVINIRESFRGEVDDHHAQFGADGHPFIAELRPPPAISPRELVTNIHDSLSLGLPYFRKYSWHAGPWIMTKPLGGHIHFGMKDVKIDNIVDALNYQVSPILALIEPQEEAASRRTITFQGAADRRPYGILGDVRKKDWGFEWRTPSSFIVSPGVSIGLLALTKAVAMEEMIGGKCAYSMLPSNARRELRFSSDDFHSCKKEVFMRMLPSLWRIIRNMRYFEPGQEGREMWSNVSFIKNKIIPNGGYDTNNDVKKKWGLELVKDADKINAEEIWRIEA